MRNTQLYLRYEKQLKTINIIESESGVKEVELELLEESLSFQEREKRFFEVWSLAVMPSEYGYLIESAEISNDNTALFVTEIITSYPAIEQKVTRVVPYNDLQGGMWAKTTYAKVFIISPTGL